MRTSRTLSVSIRCASSDVYAFVSDPENLPAWAPGFCQAVRRIGEAWIVDTPQGAMTVQFAPWNTFGVLDHVVRTEAGEQVYVPMRVVPNGSGSEVLFTLFRLPDMSDEAFEHDGRLVAADLDRLRTVLEARAPRPN